MEDDELINFSSGEVLMLIGHLTNAVLANSIAIRYLMRDDRDAAAESLESTGEQIDALLAILRNKVGEDVVDDEG